MAAWWLGGAFLYIPFCAQLFNDEIFLAPFALVAYFIYCAVGITTTDPFAWVIPAVALFVTVATVVVAPLPATEVTWNGKAYMTLIISERGNETLVFDQDRVTFSTYPTTEMMGVRPCFRTLSEGSIPWVKSTQPGPQCPSEPLPVRG